MNHKIKKLQKIQEALKGEEGTAYVPTIVTILVIILFLSILVFFALVIARYNTAVTAIKNSITNCAKMNLNNQYSAMIEGETWVAEENYESYKTEFYKAMGRILSADSEDSKNGSSYTVYDNAKRCSFKINDVNIEISPENRIMPDGVQKRLVYTVSGTFDMPISLFGYTGHMSIPIRVVASYQLTI